MDMDLDLFLLKTWLNFSHGGTDRDSTQEQPFKQINLAAPLSPVHGSVKCFSPNLMKELHFQRQYQ